VILKSGLFSTRGTLSHGIKAAGARTVYQGGFNVEKLRVTETGGDETLVGWKSVMSEQLKLQLEPNGIDVGDVRLSQPSGKIIIEKDTTLNLAKVIKTDAEPKREEVRATASTAVPFPYRVRRVLVSGGISSTRNGRAQVKLDGRVDDYGTAKVDGELNTSDPKAFTNIGVIFRNVEMSRLTPYSGKFAGRRIDSGKLSVDLKYKIDNAALAGENQIVVERLKLGEKVESPDAVNLPLDLAVALLEDSNGVIDLGLPVRGNLDSPEFSYGALIGKAILNLLTKIVTSPFRALAALIPGAGEESFKKVDFEPGSAEVIPPEKEKLARLATALQKRPQLKLSVEGRYNPETDRAVLRTAGLRRALATRLGQEPQSDTDSGPVDYSSPETEKALEVMFSERFGADALKTLKAELKAIEKVRKEEAVKNKAVAEKAEDPILPAKLLFRRLEEVQPVDDAALARLADSRASAVIADLRERLAIPAERLGAKPSTALEKDEPVTAELALEIMR
jgi:outer membrane protein OmpA-like peptidoglycan-associated protein